MINNSYFQNSLAFRVSFYIEDGWNKWQMFIDGDDYKLSKREIEIVDSKNIYLKSTENGFEPHCVKKLRNFFVHNAHMH